MESSSPLRCRRKRDSSSKPAIDDARFPLVQTPSRRAIVAAAAQSPRRLIAPCRRTEPGRDAPHRRQQRLARRGQRDLDIALTQIGQRQRGDRALAVIEDRRAEVGDAVGRVARRHVEALARDLGELFLHARRREGAAAVRQELGDQLALHRLGLEADSTREDARSGRNGKCAPRRTAKPIGSGPSTWATTRIRRAKWMTRWFDCRVAAASSCIAGRATVSRRLSGGCWWASSNRRQRQAVAAVAVARHVAAALEHGEHAGRARWPNGERRCAIVVCERLSLAPARSSRMSRPFSSAGAV